MKNFKIAPIQDGFGLVITAEPGTRITDLEKIEIEALFKQHRTILFTGFEADVEDFKRFTDRHCETFSDYKGGGSKFKSINREIVNNDKTLMTTTGSAQSFPIPLHGEMYYMSNPPQIISFYCEVPPETAGETTVCDGVKLFEALDEETANFFKKNRIKYIRNLTDGDWQLAFMTENIEEAKAFCADKGMSVIVNAGNSIAAEYLSEAVCYNEQIGKHVFINNLLYLYFAEYAFESGWVKSNLDDAMSNCPMIVRLADGSKIPYNYIDGVMKAAKKITYDIAWKTNDLVLIDNTTVMHGRNETKGTGRKILVRMGDMLNDQLVSK